MILPRPRGERSAAGRVRGGHPQWPKKPPHPNPLPERGEGDRRLLSPRGEHWLSLFYLAPAGRGRPQAR